MPVVAIKMVRATRTDRARDVAYWRRVRGMISDDQRTDAAPAGDEDAGGATDAGAPGGVGGTTAPGGGTEGAEGTYPTEKLDLGGGTSDGDTPSTDDGG